MQLAISELVFMHIKRPRLKCAGISCAQNNNAYGTTENNKYMRCLTVFLRVWGLLLLAFVSPSFAQPMIHSVSGPEAGSYDNTNTLEFVVAFSEDIQVTPTDDGEFGFLVLSLDSGNAYAAYQSHNSSSITFSYTPSNQDFDFNGLQLLGFQGLQVTNDAGFAANFNLTGLDDLPRIEIVHGNSASLPALNGYLPGDQLTYTLRWGRITQIEMLEGIPQLSITVGNNQYTLEGVANNQGEIAFSHVVTESDMEIDSVIIGELDLNDVKLIGTLDGRGDTSFGQHELIVTNRTFINNGFVPVTLLGEESLDVLVAGDAIPRIKKITVPESGDYLIGDTLAFSVEFNQQVTSTDIASTVLRIALDQGREIQASYVSDSGAQDIWQFEYSVTAADKATNGIRLLGMGSNGQYHDEGSNYAFSNWRDLVLYNVSDSTGILLNKANTASIVSFIAPDLKAYVAGDTLSFTLNYSQSVVVDGVPLLYLTLGDTQVVAQYVEGSGTSSLTFNYVLAPGLENFKGVSVDELVLNGASVVSASGVSADELLTNLDNQAPVISQPQDLELNASGLLVSTSDITAPTAYDEVDGDLEVRLAGSNISHLVPGRHELTWYAVDAAGNRAEVRQSVAIYPLISLSQDQTQEEGTESRVQVLLNGEAPDYPFTVSFDVTGSAAASGSEGEDHNLSSGSVTFDEADFEQSVPGTGIFSKDITFLIHEDDQVEGNETIEVSLTGTGNFGNKTHHTTTITESNVAPTIGLQVSQNESNVLIIEKTSGLVDFMATVNDANMDDQHTLEWDFSNNVESVSINNLHRQIDPSSLESGTYTVKVSVRDNGSPSLNDEISLTYRIVDEHPTLSSRDSDGDGISDEDEGWADDDMDGQPNYLDSVTMENVIGATSEDGLSYLIESDPGLKLMLGERALASGGDGAQLNLELLPEALQIPSDRISNISGYFDFVVNGLSEPGQSVNVVLPQRVAIPADAIYRKFGNGVWFDFVEDVNNEVMSAPGSEGSCPSPQSSAYRIGLNQGDWCVQLTIEDGGPNDADGLVNGSISDPGGVGSLTTTSLDSNSGGKKSSGGGIGFLLMLLFSLISYRWITSKHLVSSTLRRY